MQRAGVHVRKSRASGLQIVKFDHEMQAGSALSTHGVDLVLRHEAIVHILIPPAKGCAGRAADDEEGFVL